MDPIHPILPVPPNIPPVTEAPRVGRVNRDQRRDTSQDGKRKNAGEERNRAGSSGSADDAPGEPRPRIDVTA